MLAEQAIRASEIILAVAYVQQSAEFIRGLSPEKLWGYIRLILSLLLLCNVQPLFVELGLFVIACILLQRFQGPYCGGSDCMSILILLCLLLAHAAPTLFWQEVVLGYLAFQLTFSYFQSGYIKIINADWRSGRALHDVFFITAYPVSQHARTWVNSPRLLFLMSWAVMLFELLFPLSLLNHYALIMALVVAASFHLANACLFGLNRFFWIWLAAYPIILWFQGRLMSG